ncbi:MAG: hypothetical protein M0Z68_03190 [Gammaproteobacteria bacterium]|nr:hypothetical protein [Gammaproteobacteria bacterium]
MLILGGTTGLIWLAWAFWPPFSAGADWCLMAVFPSVLGMVFVVRLKVRQIASLFWATDREQRKARDTIVEVRRRIDRITAYVLGLASTTFFVLLVVGAHDRLMPVFLGILVGLALANLVILAGWAGELVRFEATIRTRTKNLP